MEVIAPGKVTPLPNVPKWLLGLTNVRSNLIPLFDVAEYLSLGNEEKKDKSHIRHLVFGSRQRMASMLIDGLPLQLKLEPDAEVENADGLHPLLDPYTTGIYRINQQIWTQIDFDALFSGMGESLAGSLLTA